MKEIVPPQPANSTRITLELEYPESRLDSVLLKTFRSQESNKKLKNITRVEFKKLFMDGKISIKGQRARPSSSIATGVTYVDILGF